MEHARGEGPGRDRAEIVIHEKAERLPFDVGADKNLGRREELSMALSKDDGLTWGDPAVIASKPDHVASGVERTSSEYRIAYPYPFEQVPGRLWITTTQGGLRMVLNEADFVQADMNGAPGSDPPAQPVQQEAATR